MKGRLLILLGLALFFLPTELTLSLFFFFLIFSFYIPAAGLNAASIKAILK
jgi:hypothetical protein